MRIVAAVRRDLVEERDARLLRAAGQREPHERRDRDRIDDQQADEQLRAPQDLQVLEEHPAHRLSAPAPRGSRRTPARGPGPRWPAPRALSSAGVPLKSSSPSASTSTRSPWRSASEMSCVQKTTLVPRSVSAVDEAPQALALARVQRAGRLVEQQHRRIGEQADGDVHALAVAARQAAELVVRALLQAGLLEHPLDDRVGVLDLLQPREQPQVLRDRELRCRSRSAAGPSRSACRRSGPAGVTVPLSGARIPPSIVSSVVLPAPLGPMIASSSPRATSKLTSRTARRSPKLLATPVDDERRRVRAPRAPAASLRAASLAGSPRRARRG